MAGRPRKPTQLKIVTGTARPHRLNALEPAPPPGTGKPPYWLTGKRRWGWKRLAPILTGSNVLTVCDEDALALLSDTYGELLELRAFLLTNGYTYGTEMIRPRPEVLMLKDATTRLMKLLTEFGLTPSSRSRIKTTPVEEIDPLDKYFDGTG